MEFSDILGGVANVATGGLFGGILRLIPEGLKLWTAKGDRDHEYRMAQLQGEQARDGSAQRIAEMQAQSVAQVDMKSMDAWTEALKAQAVVTGVAWADAINILVRPVTTFFFLILYGVHKVNTASLWTGDDYAMLGGILSFWFVGRVFDSKRERR